MPADIQTLASSILTDPVRVEATPTATTAERIVQSVYFVDKTLKRQLLAHVLQDKSIERALVFTNKSTLGTEDFPDNIRVASSSAAEQLFSLEKIEQEAIQATLEATRYKITRAAEILGISRKTLLDKRKKYGLR